MISIGLYGTNGHQIHKHPALGKNFEIAAVAEWNGEVPSGAKRYETLKEIIADESIELVSLCSPVRALQAEEAITCLEAGKHVYAEKPCALNERDLDRIIEAAQKSGKIFHEMAGTAFEQPWHSMMKLVAAGAVGEVIQVRAQKSYPYHERRPQDENIDGGLFTQVGVHAARFVEHVAGVKIKTIRAIETRLGNPSRDGGLKMASACVIELENGGVASFIANYLNPPAFGLWGNESLRIFGSKGFIEATDGGVKTRLVTNEKDFGGIDVSQPAPDYFEMFLDEIEGKTMAPLSIWDELHPTRMVVRAKRALEG